MRAALTKLAGPDFQAAFGGSTDQGDYRAFPPPLADLPGIPTDGGFDTVDAATHDVRADATGEFGFGSGPANRYVSESRAPGDVYAESSLPGGPSGVPGTPFYVNLLPSWLTNDSFVLEQDAAS